MTYYNTKFIWANISRLFLSFFVLFCGKINLFSLSLLNLIILESHKCNSKSLFSCCQVFETLFYAIWNFSVKYFDLLYAEVSAVGIKILHVLTCMQLVFSMYISFLHVYPLIFMLKSSGRGKDSKREKWLYVPERPVWNFLD